MGCDKDINYSLKLELLYIFGSLKLKVLYSGISTKQKLAVRFGSKWDKL